jgi:hypothetical protein
MFGFIMNDFAIKLLDALGEQKYWILALLAGVVLVAGPSITVDKDFYWTTHPPSTLWPVVVGIGLVIFSAASFLLWPIFTGTDVISVGKGLDLTRVKEKDGVLWTTVRDCEIRVVFGRIEEYPIEDKFAIVLPCDEYFDMCVDDQRTALWVYVNRVFPGQVNALDILIKNECRAKLGLGQMELKTDTVRANSFGAGRCVMVTNPLGRPLHLALVSTATQRAGRGIAGRMSYLFEGTRELVRCLGHARVKKVVMPLLGAGHAGMNPPLALVGLLLAVAEVARYGDRSESFSSVTIVVFKKDKDSAPRVDKVVVRRALALIA